MPEIHNLNHILEEIIEDERVSASKNKKVSQAEIKQMLLDRQKLAASGSHLRRSIGEALMEQGLISNEQLQKGLEVQSQKGGKLGSILVRLGYIANANLLQFLATEHGTKSTDLFELNISQEVLNLLPARIIRSHRVLPLKVEGDAIHLAMENPKDVTAISEVEFFTGRKIIATVAPSYQIDLAIESLDENGYRDFSGNDVRQILQIPVATENLLRQLVAAKGCELMLTAGSPPLLRTTRVLERLSMPVVTAGECIGYAKTLTNENQWRDLLSHKQVQFVLNYNQLGRFRVNMYQQQDTVSLTIRYINQNRLSFADLGLPGWLQDFARKQQGLIIFASPPRQGKTTTLAAMIDVINSHGNRNIITLEDPIEYLHTPRNSALSQRQIGKDANTFVEGLQNIYKQSPDVIAISEAADYETLQKAFAAATTGHLVLTTLPAANITAGLSDMLALFPPHLQSRARQQLAQALLIVFWQRLLPGRDPDADVVAYEKLIASKRVQHLICEGNIDPLSIDNQLNAEDFCSLETSLLKLVKEHKITAEVASSY